METKKRNEVQKPMGGSVPGAKAGGNKAPGMSVSALLESSHGSADVGTGLSGFPLSHESFAATGKIQTTRGKVSDFGN